MRRFRDIEEWENCWVDILARDDEEDEDDWDGPEISPEHYEGRILA